MNSIVLMAEIVTEPEMRYTPDNLAVASMLVSFPSNRQEEPDYQVRVATFGETAQQVADGYAVGDLVTIEGQLHINTVERDGRNEKRAEVNARRVYKAGGDLSPDAPPARSTATSSRPATPKPVTKSAPPSAPTSSAPPQLDDIPF